MIGHIITRDLPNINRIAIDFVFIIVFSKYISVIRSIGDIVLGYIGFYAISYIRK